MDAKQDFLLKFDAPHKKEALFFSLLDAANEERQAAQVAKQGRESCSNGGLNASGADPREWTLKFVDSKLGSLDVVKARCVR
jgi:hypothetical protein